jgi:DNA uptake protein ComE-like DNA-binding protein
LVFFTAAVIIEYRIENGGFGIVEELVNVRGVGDKKLAKLNQCLMARQPQPE